MDLPLATSLIDGAPGRAQRGHRIEVIDPAAELAPCELAKADAAAVARAVRSARRALAAH
ncbi:hypothetical protein [Novosphingobium sp. BL-52-GroH]|uniref:hypothetical protein n=1 Tax=Novosphingobium sp. BL-52-GroH TaxID=3349877 RepID=UPI00384EF3BE